MAAIELHSEYLSKKKKEEGRAGKGGGCWQRRHRRAGEKGKGRRLKGVGDKPPPASCRTEWAKRLTVEVEVRRGREIEMPVKETKLQLLILNDTVKRRSGKRLRGSKHLSHFRWRKSKI